MEEQFNVLAVLTADQSPRKFFDQRDAGLYICRWPDGKVPSNALLYTSEVSIPLTSIRHTESCIRELGLA